MYVFVNTLTTFTMSTWSEGEILLHFLLHVCVSGLVRLQCLCEVLLQASEQRGSSHVPGC